MTHFGSPSKLPMMSKPYTWQEPCMKYNLDNHAGLYSKPQIYLACTPYRVHS